MARHDSLPAAVPSRIFAPGLLDGQVVVVTGGGSGLGRATAVELTALGARVIVAGRRREPLDETAAACEGGLCEAVACDIREEDQVAALVDGVLERHGRLDTLVNNAGGQYMSPAEDLTPKGFETVVRLNLIGTWLMTHAAATRAMIPSGGGKIVNVTLSPHHGLPGMAHSSAARAAVENLTRVLSIEWARFQIRLTAVAAGHFETDALQKYPEPVRAGVARTVPLQRLGRPEEHAWLIAFLASPAGDYYSGDVITLDGARDNWFGPWPPPGMTDEAGKPLAEERRPKTAE
jgi:citronellol/citronellal dehydrogenase